VIAIASDIGWTGLAGSLVLVAVAIVISLSRRLGLERSIVWASARAVVQLMAVGVALTFMLHAGRTIAYAWAWVFAMLFFAAETVRRRARDVPDVFALTLAAFAAAAVVSLGVLFGLGVFPLEARTLIPMAGMMIGNSMTSTVLVARRVLEELRDKRDEVEARLALGLPSTEAARPYVRAALRTALVPQIETTKAVGLVFLPGAMTGLILAGVSPVDAVQVQLAIMYLILGSVATSVTVVAIGLARRLFTPDSRLVPLPRTVG